MEQMLTGQMLTLTGVNERLLPGQMLTGQMLRGQIFAGQMWADSSIPARLQCGSELGLVASHGHREFVIFIQPLLLIERGLCVICIQTF